MKLRIAFGALGLSALLLVPATNGFGALSPRQQALCTAASSTKAALEAAIAALPAETPARARIKLQRRLDFYKAFLLAHPECP